LPLSLAIVATVVFAALVGAMNGQIVIRTRLPSFIVTLAFLFILRGLTLALSIMFADRTIVSGVGDVAKADFVTNLLFHGTAFKGLFVALAHIGIGKMLDNGQPLVPGVPKVILWWFALVAIGAFVLAKTRYGNWILAVGGDSNAAKNVGVPVKRVKISLFMLTAFCSCLFAVLQVCDIGSAAADRGLQKEFEAIIAAVIGGTLLTGGSGTVVGALIGALFLGILKDGLILQGVNADYLLFVTGLAIIVAMTVNVYVQRARRGYRSG